MISDAFEDLAQALRVLLEANWRAHADGMSLLLSDRPEAVGNINAGLNAVINGFHSLYDAIEKQLGKTVIDWYGTPELATILAIRNARHHNKANKIRHLYDFHARTALRPSEPRRYVVIDFAAQEDGADTFDVPLSWSDLRDYLLLPKEDSRLRPASASIIRTYLKADRFSEYARIRNLPEERVFFNVVPIVVDAASTIVPLIKPHIKFNSTESDAFGSHFSTLEKGTREHEVNEITVLFPDPR
jgi:hypothetical protein